MGFWETVYISSDERFERGAGPAWGSLARPEASGSGLGFWGFGVWGFGGVGAGVLCF